MRRQRCAACLGPHIGTRGPNVGEHYRECAECGRAVVVGLPYPQPCPVRTEPDAVKAEWARYGWTPEYGWTARGLRAYYSRNRQSLKEARW